MADTSVTSKHAVQLLELCASQNLTLAAAESCTGGGLAACITGVPGSSHVFRGSIVAYSNEIKTSVLRVSPETLAAHGAVSEATAREMSERICSLMHSDIGIGITGIAGPDGGTPEKPVGLVYIAITVQGSTDVTQLHLIGDRQSIREQAVNASLDQCLRKIKG